MLTKDELEIELGKAWRSKDIKILESHLELYVELEKAEAELAKWGKPFDQERFDFCKEQASHKDSLAAQLVYIIALEHALKHKKAELATRFAEGFAKGQELVKRKNQSGCCCIITDENNIELWSASRLVRGRTC